jgi:hypothetical protein
MVTDFPMLKITARSIPILSKWIQMVMVVGDVVCAIIVPLTQITTLMETGYVEI